MITINLKDHGKDEAELAKLCIQLLAMKAVVYKIPQKVSLVVAPSEGKGEG